MDWKEKYSDKITTAKEAMKSVKTGDYIVPGDFCAEPVHLIDALVERSKELDGITISHGGSVGPEPHIDPGMEKYIHFNCMCAVPKSREALEDCRADFVPGYFHQWPRMFAEGGSLHPNVALLMLTEPDENGVSSFGVSCDYTCYLPDVADITIATVNKNMPYIEGNTVSLDKIDWIIPYDEPVVELLDSVPGEIEKEIAKNVVPLIDDGSCIQIGRGKLPDFVMTQLSDKKDLGVHSEMISDGVVKLIDAGVINNSKKKFYPGKCVCSMMAGSADLYKWANHNPKLQLLPVDVVNDPYVISQNDNVISLNSAIEVDLLGQVVAEMIGSKQFTGVGGFTDFVRGASESRNGKTIVAFASTSSNGKHSRIVPHITEGAAVAATRYDVNYVVTEYGVAQLWGKTNRERVEALIAIAHPKFRAELREYAKKVKLLW